MPAISDKTKRETTDYPKEGAKGNLDELSFLKGTCDLHIHTGPDTWFGKAAMPQTRVRLVDDIDAAVQAKEAGMRAIVIKCHDSCTADRAYIARKVVPGIEVFGGLTLTHPVGGLNPAAVHQSVKFGSNLMKVVWMPTMDAANDTRPSSMARKKELGKEGIAIARNGSLLPEMISILGEVADNDLILATCHTSVEEKRLLLKEARKQGIEKILITHPEAEFTSICGNFELEKEFVDMGGYLELCIIACLPPTPTVPIAHFVETIHRMGAEHCILSTDLGQVYNPSPVQGMRMFIVNLLQLGISEKEIELMARKNPAKLLDLG